MTEQQKTLRLERLACLVARSVEECDGLIDDLIANRCEFSHRIAQLLAKMEAAPDADTFQQHYEKAHSLCVDLLRDTQERRMPGSVVTVHLSFLPAIFSEN